VRVIKPVRAELACPEPVEGSKYERVILPRVGGVSQPRPERTRGVQSKYARSSTGATETISRNIHTPSVRREVPVLGRVRFYLCEARVPPVDVYILVNSFVYNRAQVLAVSAGDLIERIAFVRVDHK